MKKEDALHRQISALRGQKRELRLLLDVLNGDLVVQGRWTVLGNGFGVHINPDMMSFDWIFWKDGMQSRAGQSMIPLSLSRKYGKDDSEVQVLAVIAEMWIPMAIKAIKEGGKLPNYPCRDAAWKKRQRDKQGKEAQRAFSVAGFRIDDPERALMLMKCVNKIKAKKYFDSWWLLTPEESTAVKETAKELK